MDIHLKEQDGITIVRLDGELIDDAPEVVEAISELFTGPGKRIIVDAGGVPFMNSTGLGELVRMNAQANIQESRLVIAAPSNFVAGVFQATRLDAFFEVYPTVEDAIANLK